MYPYLLYSSENHMIHAGLLGGAIARSRTLPAKSTPVRSLVDLAKKNNSLAIDESKHHVYKRKSQEPRVTDVNLNTVPCRRLRSPMRYWLLRVVWNDTRSFYSFRETATVLSLINVRQLSRTCYARLRLVDDVCVCIYTNTEYSVARPAPRAGALCRPLRMKLSECVGMALAHSDWRNTVYILLNNVTTPVHIVCTYIRDTKAGRSCSRVKRISCAAACRMQCAARETKFLEFRCVF